MSAPELFRLASALASYPCDTALAGLDGALAEEADAPLPEGLAAALLAFAAHPARERESDYVELFDRGVADNPLHATGYARDRAFGVAERLADVGAFYHAFGVATAGGERLDHVAVELEFYGWLLRKQRHLAAAGEAEGVEIVTDARRKFLAEHLAPLALAIARRPAVTASSLYGPVFAWIATLVAAETAAAGIEVEAFELARGRDEPEAMECAAACRTPAGVGRLPVAPG
jgi:nitrate reductase assembly molybdenum cofactor insertion protein NarJ